MFGPFSPGDSLSVYRLQRKGISLNLRRGLLQPQTPLWEAWLAFLTQQAMGQPTYVLYNPQDGEAFIQVCYRPHQAAADVAYLAPSLAENRWAANAWSRLLEGACAEVAGRGIQRVFASLPESGAEVDVFHQAGFTLYTGEEIYRLAQPPSDRQRETPLALRSQRAEDWPAIQKLCVAITPPRVRQAEGGIAVTSGWGKNSHRYVLFDQPGNSDAGGGLLAALYIYVGRLGNWLRLLVQPDASHVTEDLIRWGLTKLGDQPPRPTYCNVRQYESGVRGALEAVGFEPYATRALMVRHTLAWIKTPAQELIPALKSSAEPVPPVYRINSEPGFQPSKGRLVARRDA